MIKTVTGHFCHENFARRSVSWIWCYLNTLRIPDLTLNVSVRCFADICVYESPVCTFSRSHWLPGNPLVCFWRTVTSGRKAERHWPQRSVPGSYVTCLQQSIIAWITLWPIQRRNVKMAEHTTSTSKFTYIFKWILHYAFFTNITVLFEQWIRTFKLHSQRVSNWEVAKKLRLKFMVAPVP